MDLHDSRGPPRGHQYLRDQGGRSTGGQKADPASARRIRHALPIRARPCQRASRWPGIRNPPFAEPFGDLPYSDPWWKVIAIIVAIVAANGVIRAAFKVQPRRERQIRR